MIQTRNLELLISYLIFFLAPAQIAYHFWPKSAFVFGFRIDYLSPSIFLTDLLILSVLVIFVKRKWSGIYKTIKTQKHLIIVVSTLIIANIYFSNFPGISLIKWMRVLLFMSFIFYILKSKQIKFKNVLNILFCSSLLFSLLGITQVFFGKTIGFWIFGERSFSQLTPGISLFSYSGREFLKPYSTFGHPNSLAGYLGIILIILTNQKIYRKNTAMLIGTAVIFVCFLLTFSLGAFIALLVVLFLYYFNDLRIKQLIYYISIVTSLSLPLLVPKVFLLTHTLGKSINERLDLAYISGDIIANNLLFGSGLNTFITNLPSYKGISSYVWNLQPVHNIFLLIFSETGILFLLIYIILYSKLLVKSDIMYQLVFIFIIVTGTFDHYWLTLQQNMLLFSIIIGLSLRTKTSS